MKSIFMALILVMSSTLAQAGSPPRTSCSNEGGTITIKDYKVSILVEKSPEPKFETFDLSTLDMKTQIVQEMPDEKYGCTSRSVVFKQITLSKKDSSQMPDAYNRLQRDGALTDYFICATKHAWLPGAGETCF